MGRYSIVQYDEAEENGAADGSLDLCWIYRWVNKNSRRKTYSKRLLNPHSDFPHSMKKNKNNLEFNVDPLNKEMDKVPLYKIKSPNPMGKLSGSS